MSPYSSNTSPSNPDIQQHYAQQQAEQQRSTQQHAAQNPPAGSPPEQAPRMVQGNRQQQDEVRNACRVKQIEQLAAIPVAQEGPGGFFIPWPSGKPPKSGAAHTATSDDGKPKWDGSLTGCERKLMIYDFAGELSRLSGSDSSGEADPDSGYEPDPEDDVSEAADASSSAAESGGDDSNSESGNRDVAAGRKDLLPLLFKQVVSSSRGQGEYTDEFGASDEDSGYSLYAGDAGSGSVPVSEDEEDSGDVSDQGSISSAGESDDESGCATSTDIPDNESGGTGDSGGDENHLDEFSASNQCLTLKAGKSNSKTCSDAERNAGEYDAAPAFAENPQSSQQLSRSRQLRPLDSSRHARDARSDAEDAISDSEGNADAPLGVAPFFGKGSDSFGGQADSFDAQQNRFRLSTSEVSDALGDEHLSSVGYSETTEESSADPEDDLGPELRADILEDIAEANRKAKEDSDLRNSEYEKRASRYFEGNGFSVSVHLPLYADGAMFLEFEGKLEEKYLQPVVEAVQEKLVLSSSLMITTKDQGGCASASEFIRRAPQSLLDSIPELKFSSAQDPAFFLDDDDSLGKLLLAIPALSVPSSIVPTLLERCSEPMARLPKLELDLSGSYFPSTGEWLAQHSHLKKLRITNWIFSDKGALGAFAVKSLLLALKRNTSVQCLSLSVPWDDNEEAIAGFIENNTRIRRLSLLHYFLQNQAGAAIIQSLHLRPRLDELKISLIGLDAWTALASLIASPSCPREVTVEEMYSRGDFDTMRIISALAENRNLEVLNLDLYEFSRQAVPSFVKMVESHPTLKGIRVKSSKFSRDDVEKIERALERNRGTSVAAPAATAALQVLAGRNYPPEIIHQVIEQISTLSPQGKEDGLQTLVNLRDAVLQPGPRS